MSIEYMPKEDGKGCIFQHLETDNPYPLCDREECKDKEACQLHKDWSQPMGESTTMKDYWMDLLWGVVGAPSNSTQFSGIKYLADFVHTMPGEAFRLDPGYTMEDLGYAGSGAKMAALQRIYMDQASIDLARAKLSDRSSKEFTSVIINTQAGTKQSKSQGHCMVGIVVTRNTKSKTNRYLRISVMYRMTESIRKFGADLLFFRGVLFPAILGDFIGDLTEVSFHFANLSFSPLFFPILLDKVDLEAFMSNLRENPITHRAVLGVIRRDMEHELGFHAYRTRNVMQAIAHSAYEKNPRIKKTMKNIIKKEAEEKKK